MIGKDEWMDDWIGENVDTGLCTCLISIVIVDHNEFISHVCVDSEINLSYQCGFTMTLKYQDTLSVVLLKSKNNQCSSFKDSTK